MVCDTSSKESLSAAVTVVESHTPFVNIIVANAGVTGPITGVPPWPSDQSLQDFQSQLWETTHTENQKTLDVNILGVTEHLHRIRSPP